MSQASAQREPSMEEILSSIRRIIEDSDTTSNDNAGPSQAKESAAKPEPGDEVVEEIDAFLEELSDNRPAEEVIKPEPANEDQSAPMKDVTPVAKPETVAPIAADKPSPVAAVTVKPVESVAAPAPAEKSPAPLTAEKPAEPVSRPQARAEDVKPAAAAPTVRPATVSTPAAAAASAAKPSQPAAAPVPAKEPTPSPARLQPIVSAETGRQVQAAFGELNEAFQKSRAKSFDQVAEEMIRPMLQDWLDNNLPTLVERLVREEIERVARGE